MKSRLVVLISGDIILSILALYSGFFLRFGSLQKTEGIFNLAGTNLSIYVIVLIFSSFLVEIYSNGRDKGKKEIFLRVLMGITMSFFMLSSLYYMMPFISFGRGLILLSLAAFGLFQFLWHVGNELFLSLPGFARRVLILGTGPLAKQIGGIITSTNHYYVLTGYVDCAGEPMHVPSHHIMNNGKGFMETVKRTKAHKIVVSLSERRGVFPLKDVLSCKLSGIEVVDAPSFYEQITGKLLIENIKPSWFIFSEGFKITSFKRFTKRILDILFSLTGLLLALPLFPVIILFIKIDSKGPIFFEQIRLGEMEKRFALYKFRTMQHDAESESGAVWARENDPRITRVGKILRKTRLDELPQLYNVLRGNMSFIGPRPERPEFIDKLKEVIPYYSERHFLKPGITGWAQVKYPYGASVEDAIEKLKYDLFYIKHLSFFLEFLIFFETIKVVLFGKGGR